MEAAIPLIVLAVVGYVVYQKATTTEEEDGVAPAPKIRRTKPRPYAPIEKFTSDGSAIYQKKVLGYEESALNQTPKTLVEGPGGTKAVARTTPNNLARGA